MSLTDLLYVAIFSVSILALHLGFIQKERSPMGTLLIVFLFIAIFNMGHAYLFREVFTGYRYVDLGAPFGLLYGPLLFFGYRISHGKRIRKAEYVVHLSAFVVALVAYGIFLSNGPLREAYAEMYYTVLYTTIVVSWSVYPIILILKGSKDTAVSSIIYRYAMIILIILASFFLPLIVLRAGQHITQDIIAARLVTMVAMLLAVLTVYFYLLNRLIEFSRLMVVHTPKAKPLPPLIVDRVESLREVPLPFFNKIKDYLTKDRYLNPAFKLETMSKDLSIPKHIISQYFQQVYEDSFVRTVNAWRIEYACQLLLQDDVDFNIENLAFACGFSSRASFYRNFSQEKDCTPLAYREKYFGIAPLES